LEKCARLITCEMWDEGELGCEIRLTENGQPYDGRRFINRGAAEYGALDYRRDLEADGWTLVSPA
jgi:hypothetical protein